MFSWPCSHSTSALNRCDSIPQIIISPFIASPATRLVWIFLLVDISFRRWNRRFTDLISWYSIWHQMFHFAFSVGWMCPGIYFLLVLEIKPFSYSSYRICGYKLWQDMPCGTGGNCGVAAIATFLQHRAYFPKLSEHHRSQIVDKPDIS